MALEYWTTNMPGGPTAEQKARNLAEYERQRLESERSQRQAQQRGKPGTSPQPQGRPSTVVRSPANTGPNPMTHLQGQGGQPQAQPKAAPSQYSTIKPPPPLPPEQYITAKPPPRPPQPSQVVQKPLNRDSHLSKFKAGHPSAKSPSPYGSAQYNALQASRATGGGVPGETVPFKEGVRPEYTVQNRPAPAQTPARPGSAGLPANPQNYHGNNLGPQPPPQAPAHRPTGQAPDPPYTARPPSTSPRSQTSSIPSTEAGRAAVNPLKAAATKFGNRLKPGTMGFSPKGMGNLGMMMLPASPFGTAPDIQEQNDIFGNPLDQGQGFHPDEIESGEYNYEVDPGQYPDQGGTAPMQYVPRMMPNPQAGQAIAPEYWM